MSTHLERRARNQILFREVNERLREVLDESVGATEFLCECSARDCTETVALQLSEYEEIRSNPNRFLVSPGHELLEIERVTFENGTYRVVEKIVEADYAIRTDPRSRE
jgi:hypothetical protein